MVWSTRHSPSTTRWSASRKGFAVGDPVLEQVADRCRVLFEQTHGVRRLDVLREDEDADARVLVTDAARGDDALVGVCRRHPDVDDREVGFLVAYERHQLIDVTRFPGEIEAGSHQQ